MKILKPLKTFIYKSDFFYTTELLRYKTEPQYRTLFGGILSLLILVGLIITFYSKLIDTVNKIVITSVSSNLNAADPTPYTISTHSDNRFMFGVQIWHHDLNTGNQYFDVILTSVQLDTGQERFTSLQYPLQPCTLDHWQGFPAVQQDFSRLKMNYWLCLPKNTKYNIQGKYASVFSQTLQVAVKKCTNTSDQLRPCASQTQIDNYFSQQGSFFFTVYFINPLLNPTSEEYLTYYLEDNNYIIFTNDFGSEGILFMQEFSITTDQSILPFRQAREQKGGIVTELALKNPYQVTDDVYCSFSFFKSGVSRSYERNFQKLDEILSYIGGLFGTIAICLFIVNAYNGHSFEINLGSYLFKVKDETSENVLKNYNFLGFIVQGLYALLNSIGYQPNWKKVKQYFDCRQQMVKQLDILYLLKRVFFLERALNFIFENHQLIGLHLQQKLTLQEAKQIRKNFNIKRKLFKTTNAQNNKKCKGQNIEITQQSMDILPGKIYDSYQIKALINDKVEYRKQSVSSNFLQNSIAKNDEKPENKLQRHIIVDNEIESQQSESSEQENKGSNFEEQINKLRTQGERGKVLSQRIWQKIDPIFKNEYQQYWSKKQLISNISSSSYQVHHDKLANKNLYHVKKQQQNKQQQNTQKDNEHFKIKVNSSIQNQQNQFNKSSKFPNNQSDNQQQSQTFNNNVFVQNQFHIISSPI